MDILPFLHFLSQIKSRIIYNQQRLFCRLICPDPRRLILSILQAFFFSGYFIIYWIPCNSLFLFWIFSSYVCFIILRFLREIQLVVYYVFVRVVAVGWQHALEFAVRFCFLEVTYFLILSEDVGFFVVCCWEVGMLVFVLDLWVYSG